MAKRILLDMFGSRDSPLLRGSAFAYRTCCWTLLWSIVALGLVAAFGRGTVVAVAVVLLGVAAARQWWVRVASHLSLRDYERTRDPDA